MSIPDKVPNVPPVTSNILSLVTDPYHDYNLRATGFPDGSVSISAIQRNQGRMTVVCPFTLVAGDTWDFHVFTTPLHNRISTASANLAGNTLTKQAGSVSLGPVNVFCKHYDSAGVLKNTNFVSLGSVAGLVDPNKSRQVRTVSLGFELHNTTAELYKMGSLTVYRSPSVYEDIHLHYNGGASTAPFSCKLIGTIPTDVNMVNLLPNTRTWAASEGCYLVSLPAVNNSLSPTVASNVAIQGGIANTSYNLLYDSAYNTNVINLCTFSPLACGGVISSKFSDAQQTFELDYRQILELVPNAYDAATLAFATTAPEHDKVFLKLYKAMFNKIPPGVPVNMNSAGDWFRSIIRIVKDVLPSIAPILPGQGKLIAAAAIPIVNSIADKVLKDKVNITQRMTKPSAIKRALVKQRKSKATKKKP